jgi:hypothetical protein
VKAKTWVAIYAAVVCRHQRIHAQSEGSVAAPTCLLRWEGPGKVITGALAALC